MLWIKSKSNYCIFAGTAPREKNENENVKGKLRGKGKNYYNLATLEEGKM